MSLKSMGRRVEQRLRPFFRRVKRLIRAHGAHDRIARLERRIEELEGLFREQAGLHYLRLADESVPPLPAGESAHGRRTA